ncbi:MAG: ATP-binding protein [Gammaproteobacteria bacterium]
METTETAILGECVFIGVCVFAALQHGLVALQRPLSRTHLLFALLCLTAAMYFLDKTAIMRLPPAETMVRLQQWKTLTSVLFFVVYILFVAEYTRTRPWWLLISLGVLFLMAFWIRLLMPGAIALALVFSFYGCIRLYRQSVQRRALTLGVGVGLFLFFMLLKNAINYGYMDFYDVSEYGFLALIVIMSFNLMYELRESERRMHVVLDNVPAGIYLKDSQSRYLWANSKFIDWFGVTRDTITGKTDSELAPLAPLSIADTERPSTDQQAQLSEVEISKDGETHTYATMTVQLPVDGEQQKTVGVITDMTGLRQAEVEAIRVRQQLWRADRVASISTLTASLAHELNQPLSAILSNAQAGLRFLDEQSPNLGEIKAILDDIVRDNKRAGGVIGGLRNMLLRSEPQRNLIDLAEITREVQKLLYTEMLNAQIEVNTYYDEGCYVMADKTLILQVQLNLIINAIEAMHDQPTSQKRLEISVVNEGGTHRKFMICDHGPSISSERFNNLFSMFASTKSKGMGIGLAICRSIIESHDGKIWAERNLGQGLTFFFTLPAVHKLDAVNEHSA